MHRSFAIENIEERRLLLGIDDVELRREISGLRAGDTVNVTLLTDSFALKGETLQVRITRIRGRAFHGKLTVKPASSTLRGLRIGSPLAFSANQIHSITQTLKRRGR
jgi:hypothetical protein